MAVSLVAMSNQTPPPIVLHRIDPVRNMARFYVLTVEMTLFGGRSLVRTWGRIGTRGRHRIELFADTAAAEQAMRRLAQSKFRRGYRPTGAARSSPC